MAKIPSWSIWALVVFSWVAYNFIFDDTRKGHANYSKQQKPKCLNAAKVISQEAFDEALADPSIWQEAGYDSAYDLEKATKALVYNNCMK